MYKIIPDDTAKTTIWYRLRRCGVLLLMACAGMALLGSCTHENGQGGGRRRVIDVEFRLDVPTGQQAMTRGALTYADEYEVRTVDVLVFRGGNYLYTATGVVTTAPSAPDEQSNAEMKFRTALVSDPAPFDLMIVTNAREIIAGAYANGIPINTPQNVVEEKLLMSMPADGWVHDRTAVGYKPIPMCSYLPNQTINFNYTPSASIPLNRMVAKVDVKLKTDPTNSVTGKFELKHVRVYNYATKGRLIPYTDGSDLTVTPSLPADYYTGIISGGEAQYMERTAVSPFQGVTGELYLFEAPKGVQSQTQSTTRTQNPCVVIGGNYLGSNEETWYRIDFARQNQQGGFDFLPVLRNTRYTITVTGISGPGLPSPVAAYRSVPFNVAASITVWNDSGGVGYVDGRTILSGNRVTLPFAQNRTGRIDVTSTAAYSIQWLNPDGTPRGNSVSSAQLTGGAAKGTIISCDEFDAIIVRDAADATDASHISFRTRSYNYDKNNKATLRVALQGGEFADIAVSQESITGVCYNQNFTVCSANHWGHLGGVQSGQGAEGLGQELRSFLDTQFMPTGGMPMQGFDFYIGEFDGAGVDHALAMIARQDIIFLPWASPALNDRVAAAIFKWLKDDSRHILIMSTDYAVTCSNLRTLLVADGDMRWNESRHAEIAPAGDTGYTRAADSPGSDTFFNGPFGAIQPLTKFNCADGVFGHTTETRPGFIPLITGSNDRNSVIAAVNLNRGIVYWGDGNLFDTTRMANAELKKLIGNVWAWIVERQIYGADKYGADFE